MSLDLTSDDASPFGGMAPTVTLHDVELCRVGQWNASTGGTQITRAMLEAVVAASADPDADHVPVHPGHLDPRFPALSDGEPAMGWVERVRLTGDPGHERLVGDLTDVPARMAAIIPKAYRRRSVELAENLRTATGRTYPYALVGLGLLGVQAPAVKGLRDVAARYSEAAADAGAGNRSDDALQVLLLEDAPSGAPANTVGDAAGRHDDSQSAKTPVPPIPQPEERPVARQSSHTDEQLRQLFNLAGDADVTALREAILALPEVGDPAAPVVPAAAAPAVPAAAVPAPVAAAPAVAPAVSPAAAPATVAAVTAPTGGTNITAETTGARELIAASAGQPGAPARAGGVFLSEQQWSTVQQVLHTQEETRRRSLIGAALSSGRISPAEQASWEQALTDPQHAPGAERLLDLLPANRVPVTEVGSLGYAHLSAHTPAAEAAFDRFEDSLGLGLNRTTTRAAAQTGA